MPTSAFGCWRLATWITGETCVYLSVRNIPGVRVGEGWGAGEGRGGGGGGVGGGERGRGGTSCVN
jgi:hypothetical protein